jgi:hypothetical protein
MVIIDISSYSYYKITYNYNPHISSYTEITYAHTQVHKYNKHRYSYSYIQFTIYKFMHYMHIKFSYSAHTKSNKFNIIYSIKSFNKIYLIRRRKRL